MKRMDILARLENSTDFHKGDEARFPLDRSVGHADALCRPRGAAPGLGGFAGVKNPRVPCDVGLSCCVGMVEPTRARGLGRSFAVLLFAISRTLFFWAF